MQVLVAHLGLRSTWKDLRRYQERPHSHTSRTLPGESKSARDLLWHGRLHRSHQTLHVH